MDPQNINHLVISQLMRLETINLCLKGSQRDEVLGELVAQIPEIAENPDAQKTLLRALQERELLCSTGIGDGVALPHCRNALVGLVQKPVIVFGRHDQGIGFGSVDGSPARLFFLLVAPTVNQHLQILSRLSRLLRDSRLRQALLAVDRPDKALALIKEAEASLR